ncbi:hypothetical protein H0H81_006006, partial [Sphagnurus paluster]
KVATTVKCKVTQLLSPKKHEKARNILPDSSSDIANDSNGNPSPPLDAQSNKRRHKPEVIEINDEDEDSGDELIPKIIYVDGKRAHQFSYTAKGCQYKARWFLDTRDKASTSNLIKHVKNCWGIEAWASANECRDANKACDSVVKPLKQSGSILKKFLWKGKGAITFSHQQHTRTET